MAKSGIAIQALRAAEPIERRTWDEFLDHAPSPDAYFRPGYAHAYEVAGQGSAVAVVVQAGAVRVLFPFIINSVRDLPFAHDMAGQDAITPYGYGGILALDAGDVDWTAAIAALRSWCEQNQVVACLFRLHPLMSESKSFLAAAPSLGLDVRFRGHTTALDLLSWDEQRDCPRGMSKGRISDLSKARRTLRIIADNDRRNLALFRDLYESTMDRVNAGGFYRYPLSYYEALANGLGDKFSLQLAWQGERPVAGALFLVEGDCIHYHLSCSNDAGRELRATTLLIQAGALLGQGRGCRHFHLGGGARPDDSLWEFKRSFGGDQIDYHFATMIADRPAYDQLVAARERESGRPAPNDNFLRYRT